MENKFLEPDPKQQVVFPTNFIAKFSFSITFKSEFVPSKPVQTSPLHALEMCVASLLGVPFLLGQNLVQPLNEHEADRTPELENNADGFNCIHLGRLLFYH